MKGVLIIDSDAKFELGAVTELIKEISDVQFLGRATNFTDGMFLVQDTQPDVVFIGTNMLPGGFSKEMALKMKAATVLIPDDYLERLATIHQAEQPIVRGHSMKLSIENIDQLKPVLEIPKSAFMKTIAISDQESIKFLRTDDLICLIAERAYCKVVTTRNKFLVSRSLGTFEMELCSEFGFIRIHRSAIINVNHVLEISRSDGGTLVMSNGEELSVPSKGREQLVKTILEMRTNL